MGAANVAGGRPHGCGVDATGTARRPQFFWTRTACKGKKKKQKPVELSFLLRKEHLILTTKALCVA